MGKGIDYGMGRTNIDPATGIRYGVIHSGALACEALEDFEADYGPPTCGKCGGDAKDVDDDDAPDFDETEDGAPIWKRSRGCEDYYCEDCFRVFDSSDAFGDEPIGHHLGDGEYIASIDSYGDVFITKSPFYTRAQFCSPCAPGAVHLSNPCDDGERGYCFGHDWFDGDAAPYRVFRVNDDTEVLPG